MKNITKKIVAFAATAALTITSAVALADTLQIGVPDDGTNSPAASSCWKARV